MDNESKPTDQKLGLKPRIVKPLKSLNAIKVPSSKSSFRPSRSISAVKSVLPIRVAPLGISGTTGKKEEE